MEEITVLPKIQKNADYIYSLLIPESLRASLSSRFNFSEIEQLSRDRYYIEISKCAAMVEAFAELPDLSISSYDFNLPHVTVGSRLDIPSEDEYEKMEKFLLQMCPWKKGPFSIFGKCIDAEWRSDLKWKRILDRVPFELTGKRIADVGCNNGYYMYRIAAANPDCVIGFEPTVRHSIIFAMLQKYTKQSHLGYLNCGVEHIIKMPKFFDVVFLMGILYHHTDPIQMLRDIHLSLNTGGWLCVDTFVIEDSQSVSLTPDGRYAGARGVWFIPSRSCLFNWLKRAGYRDAQIIFDDFLTSEEQRATAWAEIPSLSDYLQADGKTAEGYDAPRRCYVVARR